MKTKKKIKKTENVNSLASRRDGRIDHIDWFLHCLYASYSMPCRRLFLSNIPEPFRFSYLPFPAWPKSKTMYTCLQNGIRQPQFFFFSVPYILSFEVFAEREGGTRYIA